MAESLYGISAVLSVGEANASVATWNSSTPSISGSPPGPTSVLLVNSDYSYNTINVSLDQAAGLTDGELLFQGSLDGVNFFPIQGSFTGTLGAVGPTYSIQPGTYAVLSFNLTAIPYFRVQLNAPITGIGSVIIGYAADSFVSPSGGVIEVDLYSINGTTIQSAAPGILLVGIGTEAETQ